MIRVAVVDDQELVRDGFGVLISMADDMEVVGEAADGLAAVEMVRRERPDVVLMDIRMPGMDGLEATRRIVDGQPSGHTKVMILTTFDLDEYVYEALRSGASGFLLKDTSSEDLVRAIRVIAGGESLLSPKITSRLVAEFAKQRQPDPQAARAIASLTEREAEVLNAVARGHSNAEITDLLHMSYGTVKTHISHLLTKLDCRDRAQLVMVAYETGFITPGDPEPQP